MTRSRVIIVGVVLHLVGQVDPTHARPPLSDSTDVRISDSDERETSVFVSPLNPDVVLVFNNNFVTGGARASISTNGGLSWPYHSPGFGGDPGTAIVGNSLYGPHGRFVALALGGGPCEVTSTICVHYANAPAGPWTSVPLSSDFATDKPHVTVDNSPSSPPELRYTIYASWTNGNFVINGATSTDGGASWVKGFSVTHVPSTLINWSPNLQTGRTGRMYLMWSRMLGSGPGSASD